MKRHHKQNRDHKASRLEQARDAYGVRIEKILAQDETAPKILRKGALSVKFNAFAQWTDPTHEAASRHKYLDWICRVYLARAAAGKPILAEDLRKIRGELKDFEAFKEQFAAVSQREIDYYRTYDDFLVQIRPYQQARDAKKIARAKMTEEVMAGTIVVYDGPEGKIVRPTTVEAAQFWGMGTRWCISATETPNYFHVYYNPNKDKHVYIYLPANISRKESERALQYTSFKFAAAGGDLWDETDEPISYIPSCLNRLISAAERSCGHHDKSQLGLYGQYHDKPAVPADEKHWDAPAIMAPVILKSPSAVIYTRNIEVLQCAFEHYRQAIREFSDDMRVVLEGGKRHQGREEDGPHFVHARMLYTKADAVRHAYGEFISRSFGIEDFRSDVFLRDVRAFESSGVEQFDRVFRELFHHIRKTNLRHMCEAHIERGGPVPR